MYKVIYHRTEGRSPDSAASIQEEILEKVRSKLCLERRDELTKSNDM